MISEIFRAIAGLAFVIYIPGYLLCRLVFKEMSLMDRLCLSAALSIVIDVALAFVLSLTGFVMGIPLITEAGVWLSLLLVSALLGTALLGQAATRIASRRGAR